MAGYEMLPMGRKAESIYTAMEKRRAEGKREMVSGGRRRDSAFEEHMRRNGASKACYVYINGISMPVLSA